MMTHGEIGLVESNSIWLPADVLKPIAIRDGTAVLAYYYPTPKGSKHAHLRRNVHDIILTPIPYETWLHVARFTIRLNHWEGTLEPISAFLRDKGISILNAECSRSAHRYATWNMMVWLRTLSRDTVSPSFTCEEEIDIYASGELEKVKKEISELEQEIDNRFRNSCLFVDSDFDDLSVPIESHAITQFSYFYRHVEKTRLRISKNPEDGVDPKNFEPFTLSCQNGFLRDESRIRLKSIFQSAGFLSALPTCAFAEMETKSAIIRLAIIEPKNLARFFIGRIRYERHGYGKSSSGLLADIAQKLKSRYDLWRVYNHTMINEKSVEYGEIIFYFEDTYKTLQATGTENLWKQPADDAIGMLRHLPPHLDHITIKDPLADPIRPEKVTQFVGHDRRGTGKLKYGVFISYAHEDNELAVKLHDMLHDKGCNPYIALKQAKLSSSLSTIRTSLLDSCIFAVFYSRAASQSAWVNAELGVAWAKRMPICLIRADTEAKLPPWMGDIIYFDYKNAKDDLDHFVDAVSNLLQERQENPPREEE